MQRQAERIFQAFYIDAFEKSCLLFVADEDCDREAEFRKAYMGHYGTEPEDAELLSVSLVTRLYHNGVDKDYRIQVVEK